MDNISRLALRAVYTNTDSLPVSHVRSTKLMGGDASACVVGGAESVCEEMFEVAVHCENLWSRFIEDSDVSRLNLSAGKPVTVDELTVQLLEYAKEMFTLSEGSFNPTLLSEVADAGYTQSVRDRNVDAVLPAKPVKRLLSLEDIIIEGLKVTLPKNSGIDFGGIAKGFTADLMVRKAEASGVVGAFAVVGGDGAVYGDAPNLGGWRIGVENPFDKNDDKTGRGEHVDVVTLQTGEGIATSSVMKRRWGRGGNKTHHLINPVTGQSAETKVLTVTVIAENGAKAEALTKRGFFVPFDEYLTWLDTVNAVGFMVFEDGTTAYSKAWKNYR